MKVQNDSNVNFKAYLNISAVKNNQNLWERASNVFAQETTDLKGIVDVFETEGKISLIPRNYEDDWNEYFSKEGSRKLQELPAEKIGKKLADLYKFISKNHFSEELYKHYANFWSKIEQRFQMLRTDSDPMQDILGRHIQRGVDIADDLARQKRYNFLNNDRILRDLLQNPNGGPHPSYDYQIRKSYLNLN